MTAAYILTVVTYLSGASWGPVVSFQEFSSLDACTRQKEKIELMVKDLTAGNTLQGGVRPERMKVSCDKK